MLRCPTQKVPFPLSINSSFIFLISLLCVFIVGRLIETGKELISTSTVGTQTDDDDDAPYFVAVAIASIFTTFFTALFFFLEVFCAVLGILADLLLIVANFSFIR